MTRLKSEGLFCLNDATQQAVLKSHLKWIPVSGFIGPHTSSCHYAEMPRNISVNASDSHLKTQVCSGGQRAGSVAQQLVLKFSGDGTAVCNDWLGSKHLCAKGPGLQRIEIRQELISCESYSVFSQTEATLQEQIINVSLLSLPRAVVCQMFLWRRHPPLPNVSKQEFSALSPCLVLSQRQTPY